MSTSFTRTIFCRASRAVHTSASAIRLSLSAALCRSLYLIDGAEERERHESMPSREQDEPVAVFLDVVKLALDFLPFTPRHR